MPGFTHVAVEDDSNLYKERIETRVETLPNGLITATKMERKHDGSDH